MSKKADLAKNTFILAVGKGIQQIATFLLIPLYTLHLSPKEYGTFDLITTYVLLLAPVLTLQLEMAVFRLLIDARSDEIEKRKVISSIVLFDTAIVALIGCIIAIVQFFIHQPMIWLIYVYLVVFIFSGLFLQIARGLGRNRGYALAGATFSITLISLAFVLVAHTGLGIEGVIISFIGAYLVSIMAILPSIKLPSMLRMGSIRLKTLQDALRYSLPLVPNGASIWVMSMSDRTIITLLLGAAANGIYAIASRFSAVYSSIFNIFYLSWTEAVSLHIKSDDDQFISKTMNSAVTFFASLALVIISCMPFVFTFLVGDNFNESYNYIPLLIVSSLIASVMSAYGSIYLALKRTKKLMSTTIVVAVINIALSLILTPALGLYGPAFAMILSYTLIVLYRHRDISKFVYLSYDTKILLTLCLLYIITLIAYYSGQSTVQACSVFLVIIGVTTVNSSSIKILIKGLKNRATK